jgi:hypothetical protein
VLLHPQPQEMQQQQPNMLQQQKQPAMAAVAKGGEGVGHFAVT